MPWPLHNVQRPSLCQFFPILITTPLDCPGRPQSSVDPSPVPGLGPDQWAPHQPACRPPSVLLQRLPARSHQAQPGSPHSLVWDANYSEVKGIFQPEKQATHHSAMSLLAVQGFISAPSCVLSISLEPPFSSSDLLQPSWGDHDGGGSCKLAFLSLSHLSLPSAPSPPSIQHTCIPEVEFIVKPHWAPSGQGPASLELRTPLQLQGIKPAAEQLYLRGLSSPTHPQSVSLPMGHWIGLADTIQDSQSNLNKLMNT